MRNVRRGGDGKEAVPNVVRHCGYLVAFLFGWKRLLIV
jgi:hypothetical protein